MSTSMNGSGPIPHYESRMFPDQIPSVPTHNLPQTGTHPIELYMAVLGQNRKQFLENIRVLGVPVSKIGTAWLVDAETLYSYGYEDHDDDE